MPLGLYTGYQVSAPCGLCSTEGNIGLLDVPDHFLDPSRMQASLVWFGRGYLEYKFPNMPPILRTPARDWSILSCRDDNDRPPRRCRRPTTRRHERRIPLRP